jgi:hypothetical protein
MWNDYRQPCDLLQSDSSPSLLKKQRYNHYTVNTETRTKQNYWAVQNFHPHTQIDSWLELRKGHLPLSSSPASYIRPPAGRCACKILECSTRVNWRVKSKRCKYFAGTGGFRNSKKISPPLQEVGLTHVCLFLQPSEEGSWICQYAAIKFFWVHSPCRFLCSFRGIFRFRGREAMIRRKSTSPAKQAACKKETRQRLRLWGELGEIGEIAHMWRILILRAEIWQQWVYRGHWSQGRVTYYYQTREDNHLIESGYRAASGSLIECLHSWTYIHNETGTFPYNNLLWEGNS